MLCPDVGNRDIFVMSYRDLPLHDIGRGGTEAPVKNCRKPAITANLNFFFPFANSDVTILREIHHTNCDAMKDTKGANGTSAGPKLLWKHSSPETTPMYQFLQSVNKTHDLQLSNYSDLHQWSINNVNKFWQKAWDFVGVKHQGVPTSVSWLGSIHVIYTYNR